MSKSSDRKVWEAMLKSGSESQKKIAREKLAKLDRQEAGAKRSGATRAGRYRIDSGRKKKTSWLPGAWGSPKRPPADEAHLWVSCPKNILVRGAHGGTEWVQCPNCGGTGWKRR